MPFERATVSDLEERGVLLVQDGNHGANRPRGDEIVELGIPHVRAADIGSDGAIDFGGAQQVAEGAYSRIKKGRGRPGDVLLTHKGTVGRVARAPLDSPPFLCSPQTTFWRSLNPSLLDQGFLFAYLRSRDFASQLTARMNETDMAPYVSLTAQRELVLPLPPLPFQKAVAETLGPLDDKIASNRRLASLLEETAAALFRARFVDFVGVAGLVNTEVGRVPASWSLGQLSDLAAVVRGISYRSTDFAESDVALVGLKAIGRGGGYVSRGLREYAGPYRDEHVLAAGDILVAHTDLTQAADVLGAAARVPSWEPHARLVPSLDLAVVRPRTEGVTPEFLLGVLGSSAFKAYARAHASGTTVLHLPRNAVDAYPLAVPPPEEITDYTAQARPLLSLADGLTGESRTLSELRDTLLPGLVSGRTRLRDAQAPVGAT